MPKKKVTREKEKANRKSGTASLSQNSKKESSPSTRKILIKKTLSIAWPIVNTLALCGALITIWLFFAPRVSVYPSVSLDPNNLLYTPFIVRNEGHMAIHDVKFSCSVKYLGFPGNLHAVGVGEFTNRFSDPKQVARMIASGEEYSALLPLSGLKHNQIKTADIAVVLSFCPIKWLPWRRECLHRFVSIEGKDGHRYWLPQPINR